MAAYSDNSPPLSQRKNSANAQATAQPNSAKSESNDKERTMDAGLPADFVAVGGSLSARQLLAAYRIGFFPWSVHPVTWWSPDPRAIFEWDRFHISRSLKRRLRQNPFRITFNQAFGQVIRHCARRPNGEDSWITQEFILAYENLRQLGHAHSVEAWSETELVGGLYGVAIGGLFAGESMFHRQNDASKIALCCLHQALKQAGFALFDIQMLTPVTQQLGAVEIPRSQYLQRLQTAVRLPCRFPSRRTPQMWKQ